MRICGQWFDEPILAHIAEAVQRTPHIRRTALAEQVCAKLGWYNARGQAQLGGARKALAELHRRGVIALPPAAPAPSRGSCARPAPCPQEVPLVQARGTLAELGAIELVRVTSARER